MKKILFAVALLVGLGSYGQVKNMNKLVGSWEIIGTSHEGGALQILDSNTIVMTYGGEKKKISGFNMDFSRNPIWFDFYVKDSTGMVEVKSLMEVISDDLIKWQVFVGEDRAAHFTANKGEMFYLKRQKNQLVHTFAGAWDKRN